MDINGDGNDDLIGSCFCGITYVFYGQKDGTLRKGELLKDETGNPVNMGMYELAVKSEKFYTVDKKKAFTSRAVTAVDWDNDGDYDLVMNSFECTKLCINKGDKRNPKFSDKKVLLPIHKNHFAYDYVDWDGDGLWDVICGGYEGGVFVYKNKGKKGKPVFDKAECLLTPEQIDPEISGMHASQVRVCDYNNDGKKDILIGINGSISKWMEGITVAQKAEYMKAMKEYEVLTKKAMKVQKELEKKCGDDRQLYLKEFRANTEIQTLYREASEALKDVRSYKSGSGHAFVYVSYGE